MSSGVEVGLGEGPVLTLLYRSHILMICVVAALSVHFYIANQFQRQKSGVLEQTVQFQYQLGPRFIDTD